VARTGAFIEDLDRRAQLLDYDIAAAEERAQLFNPSTLRILSTPEYWRHVGTILRPPSPRSKSG
jgi:hypothetical protein